MKHVRMTREKLRNSTQGVPSHNPRPTFADKAAAVGLSGRICAWAGCEATVEHGDHLPPEWSNLLLWWSPAPDGRKRVREIATSPFCRRDWVLCGEHTKALDMLLKPLRK